MKNRLSLLLFSVLFFMLSCGKDKPFEESDPCPPVTLVTKVSGTTNLDFVYDVDNSLIKIKDGENKRTEIFYDDFIFASKIQYSDSTTSTVKRKVVELHSTSNDLRPETEFESDYEGDQLVYKSRNAYAYTDVSITKVLTSIDNNSVITQKYTLKNGNIASFDNGKGTIYTYKYDNKRNPFANRLLKYRIGPVDFFSVNSIVEVEENQNGIIKITKNQYTYNQAGYPITMVSVNSAGTIVADYKFEYGTFPVACY